MADKLGDRIRELRLAHPVYKSLRQFADTLGKSPSWVSKVERNLERPGRETLEEIARMLGANSDELFHLADQLAPDVQESLIPRQPEVLGLLRTLKFLTPQQIKELEDRAAEMKQKGPSSHVCDDEMRLVNPDVFLASRLQVPWLHDRDIEAAAFALRAAFASAQAADGIEVTWPPVCPETLIYEFLDPMQNLFLDTETMLGCDENGFPIAGLMKVYDEADKGGEIRIDQSIVNTPLYPFTLAHEIGHWILHRQHVLRARQQISLFDERPVQTQTLHRSLEGSKGKLPPEEWQANRFAAHLLMPADLVTAEFLSRYGEPLDYSAQCEADPSFRNLYTEKRFYSRRVADEHYCKDGEVVRPLWEMFNVSCQAMSIRLEELGLIVDSKSPSKDSRLALS